MLIANGIFMAIYQVAVLGWYNPCLATMNFLVVGGIALVCLIRVENVYNQ